MGGIPQASCAPKRRDPRLLHGAAGELSSRLFQYPGGGHSLGSPSTQEVPPFQPCPGLLGSLHCLRVPCWVCDLPIGRLGLVLVLLITTVLRANTPPCWSGHSGLKLSACLQAWGGSELHMLIHSRAEDVSKLTCHSVSESDPWPLP